MKPSIAEEISEYNKLGYCMKETAQVLGMVCGCAECSKLFREKLLDKKS